MARLRRMIKRFIFEEKNRSKIILGTGIRLEANKNRLVLDGPPYDTAPAAPVIAKTWVTNPKSVKQWLSFQVVIQHGTLGSAKPTGEPMLIETTAAGYRLGDGTNEYWWDGGAWVVNTTNFNTEAEVADNIASFPVASQSLQVIVNLTTTDEAATPILTEIKVLFASDVEFLEDIVYRSLVRSIRENVRPISDYVIQAPGGTSIDLNAYPLETPYNVVGIDSVYDRTNDPDRLVDLFQSYDSGTKIITLSAPIAAGDLATIRFYWEPEVAVTTSQDYSEIAKVPAVVLDDINIVDAAPVGHTDSIVRKSDLAGVKIPPPIQGDIEVVLQGLTDKGVDQKRLADELAAFFENHSRLVSRALDEEFSLWLIDEYDMRTPPGSADLHTGRLRFRVRDVTFYVRDSVDSFGVKRFLATGTEDFVLSE